ncbi:hypothetical protein H8356DRAFT_450746 [Neocallimastix lanati (nom. inval.)]|uniref:Uncharacterized protein n=1 Tax=Neocallimastix californiae TaxID=1754190 RepID=A0A1Y2DKS1_9FUNG|nr:hypothetical protein H8356DRAFT_450746 [Neocallimastix sp. JGI-2020a]ORY59822.1 hypothetical protein LY90DRAFT_701349 [Neocallimastix californiae]|eukprot:ORY59822.1 hypothetical protein LY90DRAFT_701349 [Neocallimastix californiae]
MDNRTSILSLKRIKLSADSLTYCFGFDTDLSQRKANMKDIPYMLLSTTIFFSLIC